MKHRSVLSALGFTALLLAAACGGGGDGSGGGTQPTPRIAVSPVAGISLQSGQSGQATITISRGGGYTGAVTLTAEGLPAGVTAAPVTVAAGATSGTLTFNAGSSAAAGSATITIRATGPGVTDQTITVPITVTAPAPTTTLRQLAEAKGKSFGVALDQTFFNNNAAYNAVVAREFDMATPGNVMKWSSLNRDNRFTYRWQNPDALVAFAQANGMKVRGHTLAWYQQNPDWLVKPATPWSADTLKQLLKEHIDSVVGHYKGKIYAWDVVNEALNDGTGTLRTTNLPWAPLGRPYIDSAFAEARRVDPGALLFYNDYNLETPGLKQDSAYALVKSMKDRGVPIDGVGFQAHLLVNDDGSGAPSKATLLATFARFAALGLKIEVTELDVRVHTPTPTAAALAAQAQAYGNVVSACVETPACDAIVVWGLNDGESWIPGTFPGWGQALLFDDAYGKKATYNAVRAALGG